MKRLKIRESKLRNIIKKIFESNVISIFRPPSNSATLEPTLIEIRGTIEFSFNEDMGVERISAFAVRHLGIAAAESSGAGRWQFVEVGERNLSSISGFDSFSSSNDLALVSPFELIHPETNHYKFFMEFLARPNEEDPRVYHLLSSAPGMMNLKEEIQSDLSERIRESLRSSGIKSAKLNFYRAK